MDRVERTATITAYNQTAKSYEEKTSALPQREPPSSFISAIAPRGHVLDLGCGPGLDAAYFIHQGFEVTGIDLSEEMLSLARKNAPEARFILTDIEELGLPGESFDAIWAQASLLHLAKDRLSSVLAGCFDLLRAGGVMQFSLKIGEGSELLADARYNDVKKFYQYYQLNEVESIIAKTSFRIQDVQIAPKRPVYDTHDWLYILMNK